MTNEAHDPWALLRDAREWLGHGLPCATICGECIVIDRIDAALAEHDAKERYEAQADERKAIWRAYAERQLSEDEAKARLAALEGK